MAGKKEGQWTIWALVSQEAVLGGEEQAAGRTLVFAANVAAANEVAASLAEAGMQPLVYHRDVPAPERAAALEAIRDRCGLLDNAALCAARADSNRSLVPLGRQCDCCAALWPLEAQSLQVCVCVPPQLLSCEKCCAYSAASCMSLRCLSQVDTSEAGSLCAYMQGFKSPAFG